jgi:hypothetical protein
MHLVCPREPAAVSISAILTWEIAAKNKKINKKKKFNEVLNFVCFKDHVIPISFQACPQVVIEMVVIFCISTPYSNGNCLLKRY